jgi:hypothetical protein
LRHNMAEDKLLLVLLPLVQLPVLLPPPQLQVVCKPTIVSP